MKFVPYAFVKIVKKGAIRIGEYDDTNSEVNFFGKEDDDDKVYCYRKYTIAYRFEYRATVFVMVSHVLKYSTLIIE